MLRALTLISLLALCALVACGDDTSTPDAGASDADAEVATYDAIVLDEIAEAALPLPPKHAVNAPALPAQMVWQSCDSGWAAETSTRAIAESICRPFSGGAALDCPPGTAQRPGDSMCVAIGAPCPAGEFSDQLPSGPGDNVVFVHAGESINDAIVAAPPNSIIALANVAFHQTIYVPPGIRVFGACPSLTSVDSATVAGALNDTTIIGSVVMRGEFGRLQGTAAEALIGSSAAAAEVFDNAFERVEVRERSYLILHDSAIGGASVDGFSSLDVWTSFITGPTDILGSMYIAYSVARGISVHGVGATFRGGGNVFIDAGLSISEGATATIEDMLFEDVVDTAVEIADAPTTAMIANLVVRRTRVSPTDRRRGRGLVVVDGAHATITAAVLERNLDFGVVANAAGTELIIEDLVVRDTRPNSIDLLRGIALSAQNGASLRVSRALLERNSAGIAGATGASFFLEDITIDTTVGLPHGDLGYGIALTGNTAELHRVAINDARFHGVLLAGADTVITGDDLRIARVAPQNVDALYGRGLGIEGGAHVTLERVSIEDTHETALSAIDPNSELSVIDLSIARTSPRAADGKVGYGLLVQGGASTTIERATIEASTKVAVVANVNSPLSLTDVAIRDTTSDPDGDFGMGLVAASTTVSLSRVALERNRHTALRIEGESAVLRASDLRIDGTRTREKDNTLGAGIIIFDGAHATLERVVSEHNRVYAISVNRGAVLDATDVIASHTGEDTNGLYASGLYVQDNAIARVTRGRFNDNAQVGVIAQVLSHVELENVEVSDTRRACVPESAECLDQAGGIGIGSYASSSVTAHVFKLQRSAVAGAALATGGVVDFSIGEIRDQPIGINIETEGFMLERAGPGVLYINNVLASDGSMLPVPNGLGDIPSPLD